ncbi:MAG: hypothetical protein GY854_26735, partial [Deltaproteobacteria bacterium]|nr:hypothetical protein [Deltaproteobacteria bacterium]
MNRYALLINRLKTKLQSIYGRLVLSPITKWSLIVLFLFFASIWAWCKLSPTMGNSFAPDAYAYILLGQNVFKDHGFSTFAVRDIQEVPAWPLPSRSFPPLLPVLSGLVDWCTGLGIKSGAVINLSVFPSILLVLMFLGKTVAKKNWLLFSLPFILFFATNRYYRRVTETGLSTPITMLFFLAFIVFFLRALNPNLKHRGFELSSGVCLCLMLLSRYDHLLVALALIPFCFLVCRWFGFSTRDALIKTGYIGGSLVIAYLPWAIRSIAIYGIPFASNNSITVFNITKLHSPICYWIKGTEPETLFTNFDLWLSTRTDYLVINWHKLEKVTNGFVYVTPIVSIALWSRLSKIAKTMLLICLLHAVILLFTISLTPFHDLRYWSQCHLSLYLVFCLVLIESFKGMKREKITRNILIISV